MNVLRSILAVALLMLSAGALLAQPAHTVVPPGNVAIFRVQAQDDAGNARTATGATVTVDRPDMAYIAPDTSGHLVFVAKGTPAAGSTVTVTATITAKDDRGNALTPLVMYFDVPGPALPPPATHTVVTEGPFVRDQIGYTPPADPGTASVGFSF